MILEPEIHAKGWGYEKWVVNSPLYCGKILVVNQGKKCSLHYHRLKTETMLILSGQVKMHFGSDRENLKTIVLRAGEVFHIEPLLLHQFEAISDAQIAEFSTQHFEPDSYRVEKGD